MDRFWTDFGQMLEGFGEHFWDMLGLLLGACFGVACARCGMLSCCSGCSACCSSSLLVVSLLSVFRCFGTRARRSKRSPLKALSGGAERSPCTWGSPALTAERLRVAQPAKPQASDQECCLDSRAALAACSCSCCCRCCSCCSSASCCPAALTALVLAGCLLPLLLLAACSHCSWSACNA